ncbi:hypothetical protein BKA70DRAFT_1332986 [Coprinopsis sp. MPI-PUGE-AT-0042]|nr:hypothetical protein BKA70DRAFT_1332986 [Coprinopsis sp. MPI-PUGE-AT-0042]
MTDSLRRWCMEVLAQVSSALARVSVSQHATLFLFLSLTVPCLPFALTKTRPYSWRVKRPNLRSTPLFAPPVGMRVAQGAGWRDVGGGTWMFRLDGKIWYGWLPSLTWPKSLASRGGGFMRRGLVAKAEA